MSQSRLARSARPSRSAALLAAIALMAGLSVGVEQAHAATSPFIEATVTSVTVSGMYVSAKADVKTTDGSSRGVSNFGVCVRDEYNHNLDFSKPSATITASGTNYASAVKNFANGTYSYFWCVYYDGVWYNGPVRTFAVGSTPTPTPTPTVTATPTPTATATPTGPFEQLALSATVNGTSVVATTTVRSTTGVNVAAENYGVCARTSSGGNVDFGKPAATITPIDTAYTSANKTFSDGTYTFFPCVYAGGTWYNVGSTKTFTVPGLTSSPSPTASSTSTPTSSPTPTVSPTEAPTASPTPTPTPTTASPSPTTGPVGPGGTWHQVFGDEFNNGALDTTKWTVGWFGSGITPPVQSQEQECYDPAQVSVSGGSLHLSLIAKQETCGGTTRPFASGLIGSSGKFEFTYGYAEARVYLPAAADGSVANWPAFWTDGHNWPSTCENDIMEGLGGGAAYHYMNSAGTWWGGYAPNPNSYTGWHTFASDWEPGSVTYYYDGVKLGTLSQSCSAPHYLILNNATEKNRNTIADMKVDWVRVWKH